MPNNRFVFYHRSLVCAETSGNIVAYIGPRDHSLKLYMQSFCEQYNMIHFDTEPSFDATYSFNLFPSMEIICRAYVDLINMFDWKHTAVIYDSKTSMEIWRRK